MTKQTYIQRDIIDDANIEAPLSGYSNRETVLTAMLPDAAEVHTAYSGGYQGEVVVVIEYDEHIWLAHDWYGSCTGCDYCLSDPRGWGEDFLRRLYCFPSRWDAEMYLASTDEFGWNGAGLREDARELLDELSV